MKYSLSQVAQQLQVKRDSLLKLERSMPQLALCTMRPVEERYDEEDLQLLREKLIDVYAQGSTLAQYLRQNALDSGDLEQLEPIYYADETSAGEEVTESVAGLNVQQDEDESPGLSDWYSDKLYIESQGQQSFVFLAENRDSVIEQSTEQLEKDFGESSDVAVSVPDDLYATGTADYQQLHIGSADAPLGDDTVFGDLQQKLDFIEKRASDSRGLVTEISSLSAILRRAKNEGR